MTHIPSQRVVQAVPPGTDGALAHYRLNGSLVNLGSAGSANLTVGAGTEQYVPGPYPGTQAALIDGATDLKTAGAVAALKLLGALTVDAMVYLFGTSDTSFFGLIQYRNTGANADFAYLLELQSGTPNQAFFSWADSPGSRQNVTSTEVLFPWGRWVHLAMTRPTAGTSGKFFIDGRKVFSATGLLAPAMADDIPNFRLADGPPALLMADVRVFNSEKSEAAIEAIARASNPQAFLGQALS